MIDGFQKVIDLKLNQGNTNSPFFCEVISHAICREQGLPTLVFLTSLNLLDFMNYMLPLEIQIGYSEILKEQFRV